MTGHDARRAGCPGCGEPTDLRDRYCENCGRDLRAPETAPAALRSPVGGAAAPPAQHCTACGETRVDADGFCIDCGRARPGGRDRMECDLGAVCGVSDKGLRRTRNEDAMALAVVPGDRPVVVAVVCDGVATSDRGDEAAQRAADVALDVLLDAVTRDPRTASGPRAAAAIAAAVAAALDAVAALADPRAPDTAPACTFVCALVTPAEVTVGWVGDSRAYWLAPDAAPAPLTVDDTLADDLIAKGVSAEIARTVPQAGALSKWLGADAAGIAPRVTTLHPDGPGRLLLCSDGLWHHLPETAPGDEPVPPMDSEVGAPSATGLVRLALDGGGHDNITAVVVPFPPAPRSVAASPVSERST